MNKPQAAPEDRAVAHASMTGGGQLLRPPAPAPVDVIMAVSQLAP